MQGMTKMKEGPIIPVLVTTDNSRRGVFFGYTTCDLEEVITYGKVRLQGYINCIYWESTVGGVFGLAEDGPDANCKIGKKVNRTAWLNGVTFISEVSPAAVEAWENAAKRR